MKVITLTIVLVAVMTMPAVAGVIQTVNAVTIQNQNSYIVAMDTVTTLSGYLTVLVQMIKTAGPNDYLTLRSYGQNFQGFDSLIQTYYQVPLITSAVWQMSATGFDNQSLGIIKCLKYNRDHHDKLSYGEWRNQWLKPETKQNLNGITFAMLAGVLLGFMIFESCTTLKTTTNPTT